MLSGCFQLDGLHIHELRVVLMQLGISFQHARPKDPSICVAPACCYIYLHVNISNREDEKSDHIREVQKHFLKVTSQ